MTQLALLCIGLLLFPGAFAETPTPSIDQQQQIRALLREMDVAANAHDTDRFMAPFLHAKSLVFVINGVVIHGWDVLRDQQLQWWRNGKMDVVYTPQGDPEFMILKPDLMAVTRVFTSSRTGPDGHASQSTFAVSMIWQKLPGGWRIVYDHESRGR